MLVQLGNYIGFRVSRRSYSFTITMRYPVTLLPASGLTITTSRRSIALRGTEHVFYAFGFPIPLIMFAFILFLLPRSQSRLSSPSSPLRTVRARERDETSVTFFLVSFDNSDRSPTDQIR